MNKKKTELRPTPVKIKEATKQEKENFLKDCNELLKNVKLKKESTIIVEITLPTKPLEIYPEEGMGEDDFKGKKKQKELQEFREKFLKNLKDTTKSIVESYMENFEEHFFDNADDVSIEGYDNLKDYGIEVKVK
jgi:hypothetical protein